MLGTLERMPSGAFAVTTCDDLMGDEPIPPGVLFCLRSENARVRIDPNYALAPYYLVYVTDDGEIQINFTHARQVLELLKKISLGRSNPDERATQQFARLTRDGEDMARYQNLLARAVSAITGKAEEKGVESLFQRGGTALSKDSFRGIDDFEVVAYLVVLERGGAA